MPQEYIIPFVIVITLFVIFYAINMASIFFDKEKLRRITKPFPFLGAVIFLMIIHIDKPLMYLPFIFGIIGDILLLDRSKKLFLYIGAVSFLINHLLLSFLIHVEFNFINPFFIIFGIVGSILLSLVVFNILFARYNKKHDITRAESVLGSIYVSNIIYNISLSVVLLIITQNLLLLIFLFGYILFLISDMAIYAKPLNQKYRIPRQGIISGAYYIAQIMFFIFTFLTLV